jgi:PAS domain S-box-containing protein
MATDHDDALAFAEQHGIERLLEDEALRERESRVIVDTIPGLVAILTADGDVDVVNHELVEYCGQPLEAMKQWGTNGTVHFEDLPRIGPVFAQAIAAGTPYDFEARVRRFDGAYHWCQVRGLPFRDATGRILRWYVLLTDVDERKRAEEALRASERSLKLIIDTIPAMAWSRRLDGSAEFFNQHYLDFTGLSAEQASGWGWKKAVHPDDLNGLVAAWQRLMTSEAPVEAEARLRRHDGVYRWFLFRANPLRNEHGAIVRWYGVNTDIDDLKGAQERFRRSEAFLVEGQRLSRIGNFAWHVGSGSISWSEEAYRLFEFEAGTRVTLEQIAGRVHPEDRAMLSDMVERAQRADSYFEYEQRLVMPDGSIKHVHLIAHAVRSDRGGVEYIGAVQDVTTRRLAEDALDKARSELARVARAATVSTLTASIAHEINQPLSGIITNAGTCLRMLDATPPNIEGARETARRTIRDGNRAADVVSRLRALFSRKEFALEPFDLNDATREVIALSSSDLQRNRVVLQSELADDLPAITGDRTQLQQVILNLLRNASDAMVNVDDRPRQVLVKTEREDTDRVRFSVRDAGVGLAPQSVVSLFDAFYTTKSGGMGIGLFVSRSIIEKHHGRLRAGPNDGDPGATFSFSIPFVLENHVAAPGNTKVV